jgi:hypothetical protein
VASKLKAVFNACEKWAWVAVMLTWALTLLFAAALVLIDLATIIIYPFAGTEENPLLTRLRLRPTRRIGKRPRMMVVDSGRACRDMPWI